MFWGVAHLWMWDCFQRDSVTHNSMCENVNKPQPLLGKTTPIFDHFKEKLFALPLNRSVFDQNFC